MLFAAERAKIISALVQLRRSPGMEESMYRAARGCGGANHVLHVIEVIVDVEGEAVVGAEVAEVKRWTRTENYSVCIGRIRGQSRYAYDRTDIVAVVRDVKNIRSIFNRIKQRRLIKPLALLKA